MAFSRTIAKQELLRSTRVGATASDMEELDIELKPILTDLVHMHQSKNLTQPSIKQLLNWLVQPQRTGEEFTYTIWEVLLLDEGLEDLNNLNEICPKYLVHVVAESLAEKWPVLKGSWEEAAWLLIYLCDLYEYYDGVLTSHRLDTWIIQVIRDPDICPNPCLRFELSKVLYKMVRLHTSNLSQAIESVLSACSVLCIEHFSVSLLKLHQIHKIKPVPILSNSICWDSRTIYISEINDIIEIYLAKDGFLSDFDENLSERLLAVKASRCSAVVHDIQYQYALNSTFSLSEPMELYGIIALLKTTAGTVKQIYKAETFKKPPSDALSQIESCTSLMSAIIENFKASCQTPQLVNLTAYCIMDIIEVVVKINVYLLGKSWIQLYAIESLLKELIEYDEEDEEKLTPVGVEMIQGYGKRLNKIKGLLYTYQHVDDFYTIRDILDDFVL